MEANMLASLLLAMNSTDRGSMRTPPRLIKYRGTGPHRQPHGFAEGAIAPQLPKRPIGPERS